ncbi:MAG: hypothetical protein JWM58_3992 [Rhizobium sp.]|nr:hypothetical protein [Rhizobium sp.]
MSYTETTTTSWLTRIKNALVGILIGIVLIIAAIYFLFWNEGRAIQTYRSLVEGAGLVVSVDSARADPAHDGKLVHIEGPVKAQGTVADQQFGIEANGALAIKRDVEMYQWVEKSESKTEKNLGGSETTTTTYSYAKEWGTRPVDSSDFKQPGHDNPPFAINDSETTIEKATVGAFTLEGSRVAYLGDEAQIRLSDADASRIAGTIATNQPVKLNQGDLYIGQSSTSPQIGDMKIRFERVDLSEASFVGAQKGDTLEPYKSSNGREILLSAAGRKDAAAMFQQAQDENAMITWLIRAGGLLGLFIGFKLVMSIFSVLGDIVPFIGSLIGGGTSIIALVLTLIVGPVVIAIGWFAYRPLLALGIIAGGAILAVGFAYLRRKQAPAVAPPLGRAA